MNKNGVRRYKNNIKMALIAVANGITEEWMTALLEYPDLLHINVSYF